MFCTIRAFCCFGVALASIGIGSIACAQQISVVPLSTVAANANYAVSPQSNGVTFVGDAEDENDFLIVIDGDVASASLLTLSPEGAILQPGSVGPFALATPIIKLRDDEYSVSFVAIPSALKGTEAESASSQQWAADNAAWAAGRFGWGWQDSLGEWLAVNALIPVFGVENLAGASDTVLVIGTVGTVTAVVCTGFVVVEVGLGVGTLGGGAATTGTVTTAAAEAEATRRYINLIGNAVRKGKDLKRPNPNDFDF